MFENQSSRTELNEVGEFGIIDMINKAVVISNDSTKLGIGDDGAILDYSGEMEQVISTDMLTEGVHFDLSYVPLKHLGYKAISGSVSDIYAMNAKPSQVLVSIATSNRFSLEAVEELYSGVLHACEKFKVDLVGGDTTSSLSGLVISVTVIGEAKKENIVKRSGANENDLLVVTGDLGGAYMGLQLLEREKAIHKENPKIQPELEGKDYILERQLKPEARKDIFEQLEDMSLIPTSMIDISDGLASEVLHLCQSSKVGFNIYEDKLPIDFQTYDTAREFNLDPTMCALNGGEDYELLMTIKQEDHELIKNNPFFVIIGHATTEGSQCQLIAKDNSVHPISAQGWNHFTK
jgi:thiamine-monophosphate kinase